MAGWTAEESLLLQLLLAAEESGAPEGESTQKGQGAVGAALQKAVWPQVVPLIFEVRAAGMATAFYTLRPDSYHRQGVVL